MSLDVSTCVCVCMCVATLWGSVSGEVLGFCLQGIWAAGHLLVGCPLFPPHFWGWGWWPGWASGRVCREPGPVCIALIWGFMGFRLQIYPRAMGCGLGKFLGKMLFALGWVT